MNSNTIILIILSISFFLLEYYFSYKKTNFKDRVKHLILDIPYFCINIFVPAFLIKSIFYFYKTLLYYVNPSFKPLLLDHQINPTFLFIVGFIISDLVGYLTHRFLFHKKLWVLHRMHHSSKVVRWHSSFRFNPIELAITTSLIYVVYSLIGIPKYLFYDLVILNYFINYMAHSELPLGNKWIEKVLVTPNYHRLHHSVKLKNQKSNYAGVFTIWDKIFKSTNSSTSVDIELGAE